MSEPSRPRDCWAPLLPTLLGRREWGEATRAARAQQHDAARVRTRARRTDDHLTHRHNTLAPQRSHS
nr:MAG TPA: hypothetical protein [Caudoviricetes sp.]